MPRDQGYYSETNTKPAKSSGRKHPTPKQMKRAMKENPFAKAAKKAK